MDRQTSGNNDDIISVEPEVIEIDDDIEDDVIEINDDEDGNAIIVIDDEEGLPEEQDAQTSTSGMIESADMEFEYHFIKTEEVNHSETALSKEVMPASPASKRKRYACDFCNYEGSNLKDHRNAHTGEKPYVCYHCDTKFTHRSSMYNHRKRFHQEQTLEPFSCHVCDYSTKRLDYFKKHMESHSKSEGIPQTQVESRGSNFELQYPKEFIQKTQVGNAYQFPGSFICTICYYRSTTMSESETHMKFHMNGDLYACGECGYTTTTPNRMKKHKRAHVLNEPEYACNECDYWSSRIKDLKIHKETVHSVITWEYRCDSCEFKTSSHVGIKNHKRTHVTGKNSYDCLQCPSSFPSLGCLLSHIRRYHVL